MIRRIPTIVAALAVAMILYTLFTGLVLHRVSTKLIPGPICLHSPHPARGCPVHPPPPGVPIFGIRVSVGSLVTAAVTIGAMPFFAEYMNHRRRRRRYLNDECLECGHPITRFRGYCPGCGVRVGPG